MLHPLRSRSKIRSEADRMQEQFALIVRFPSATEHWYVNGRPKVGDVVAHLGQKYVVTSIEELEDQRAVVTLVEASDAAEITLD